MLKMYCSGRHGWTKYKSFDMFNYNLEFRRWLTNRWHGGILWRRPTCIQQACT